MRCSISVVHCALHDCPAPARRARNAPMVQGIHSPRHGRDALKPSLGQWWATQYTSIWRGGFHCTKSPQAQTAPGPQGALMQGSHSQEIAPQHDLEGLAQLWAGVPHGEAHLCPKSSLLLVSVVSCHCPSEGFALSQAAKCCMLLQERRQPMPTCIEGACTPWRPQCSRVNASGYD